MLEPSRYDRNIHSILLNITNITKEDIMAKNDNTPKRGFAAMSSDEQHNITGQSGKASSAKQDMSKLGKKGAAAQPLESKAEGGRNSHKNG